MLFILDEFAALGHFQLIEEASAYMAGYGIKLVPVDQNIGQIKKHYGQNWETFLANAGAIVAWSLNDQETEEYIAKRLGRFLAVERSISSSQNYGTKGIMGSGSEQGSSTGESQSIKDWPVRWPNEIHTQAARWTGRAFVVPADTDSFTVLRQDYKDRRRFDSGLYDSPESIMEWEHAELGRKQR